MSEPVPFPVPKSRNPTSGRASRSRFRLLRPCGVLRAVASGLLLISTACKEPPAPATQPNMPRGRPILEGGKREPTSPAGVPPLTTGISDSLNEKSPGIHPLVSFDFLAGFRYQKPPLTAAPSDSPRPDPIPPTIKAFDGRQVTVVGFMAPLDLDDDGRVPLFMLMRNQTFCCYGKPLEMNEWIEVQCPEGRPVKELLDVPLAASGRLGVGEKDINGIILNIYRLDLEDLRPVDPNDINPRPLPRR
ncbi:MAG: DUF3299 domain-containing protein [Phycisphaerae bacterium]|nr:DUF3299 domain-containing protein [Phycisphaerae bacterium]